MDFELLKALVGSSGKKFQIYRFFLISDQPSAVVCTY
jgi:hypothetical protein